VRTQCFAGGYVGSIDFPFDPRTAKLTISPPFSLPVLSIIRPHVSRTNNRAAERAGQKREERQQDFMPPPEKEEAEGTKKKKMATGLKDKGQGKGEKSLRELSAGLLAKGKGEEKDKKHKQKRE
jgi:hypothetical protein